MSNNEKNNDQKMEKNKKEVRRLREDLDDDVLYLDDDDTADQREIDYEDEPEEGYDDSGDEYEDSDEEYEDSDEEYDDSDEEYDDSDEEYDDSDDEYEDTDEEDEDTEEGYDDEDEVDMEDKITRHKKVKKVCAITFGSIFGILLAVYLGLAAFFHSHYYFFTEINGVDFSGKTVKNAEEYMQKQVQGYQLALKELNGNLEYINGSDISLEYQKSSQLDKFLEDQNPFLWPQAFWKPTKVDAEVGVKYDEAALAEKINSLELMKPENQTASVSATPVFNGTEFEIQPETIGTQINTEVFNKLVADSISQFKKEADLKESGCYNMPAFTSESPEVTAAKDTMNQYLNAVVTYDLNPNTETVDRTVISQWLGVDESMQVVFNTEGVAAYVADLAARYNTVGTTRTITTPSGKSAQVSGGSYGWKINQEGERDALIANIQNGEQVTRKPVYEQEAALHAANDWGNTFVEVDLSAQHMWMIQDGNVAFEADVVTGRPDPKHETPPGIFNILEKMKNKTLRGEKKPDGTYEYETPVTFWMRVTWTGIGFHDAIWQPTFGGNRYLNNGSHGCINMSYNGAATLYDLVYVGMPVIMHY